MGLYSKFTDKELQTTLSRHTKLSFIAKKELKKEFLSRTINDIEHPSLFDNLVRDIDLEQKEIRDFKYLGNLGLTIRQSGDTVFEIQRSLKGLLVDILAIIVGLIFFIIGIIGLGNISYLFIGEEKLNLFSFFMGILLITIGLSGIKMIINGLSRFIEYLGFEFKVNNATFYFKKPFDIGKKTIEGDVSSLTIEKSDHQIQLMFNDIVIIKINAPNTVNTNTLEWILKHTQKPLNDNILEES
ncbi:hypothetical protein D1816_01455 [Aquimarina sp. AD10]|uniref:hypothetical protein n=1 Tax=Aquimarina sp. AD10 TaxID=1714849 RepID=UPI000E515F4D|nr:hypothetical protein [Aquimarina sp. AD10]AXT59071.1 hypothetical protein D1816_01455 [Aquimarina sp. AD10]RKM93404.1 hypothetical protein D7033_19910 [Aquimarina sp. AD10]